MPIAVRPMVFIASVLSATAAMADCMSSLSAEYYPAADLPASMNLPFSEAVRAGDMLYVSGTIGTDRSGKLGAGGMVAEAKQAMDNIGATLKRHGASFDQVVQCVVALADIKEWAAFNEVYRHYFATHFPSRMAFATAGLALGARVEVQCSATAGAH